MRFDNDEIILKKLENINWTFEDYNSQYYPLDINNIHWYPASFVPMIPSLIIQFFSKISDNVLDPFCGSGVTLIEAARQNRNFIGFDINPYAIEISKAKIATINCEEWSWIEKHLKIIKNESDINPRKYCLDNGINFDVFKWYHKKTLIELLKIHKNIDLKDENYLIKKVAFSSILKSCCSQRKHYTYITDRCFPKELIEIFALEKYESQLQFIKDSSNMFKNNYQIINSNEWKNNSGSIYVKDARNMGDIKNDSIDLIVTSPPYLGCNDYLKSMRLTNLFFNDYNIDEIRNDEIGARWKRKRDMAEENYLSDMKNILYDLKRIIKTGKYIALVMGQGKGRVRTIDIVTHISDYMIKELQLCEILNTERNIMFSRIRFPGVQKEQILIYKKQ